MKKIIIVFLMLLICLGSFICFANNDSTTIRKIENKIKQYKIRTKSKIIFIDYSAPIYSKRLYVYDIKNKKIIKKTYVGHALLSGLRKPTDISNKIGSWKTIDGLFKTGTKYIGGSGKSMNVHGLLKKNKNTFKRRIVFHGPSYFGAIWSQGCFVVFPKEDLNYIIDNFKNGTLLIVSVE
jgi:hypothetical protein